jgi:hypothetical protein
MFGREEGKGIAEEARERAIAGKRTVGVVGQGRTSSLFSRGWARPAGREERQ